MSGSLEFFSVSWKEISAAIGSRQKELSRKVLQKTKPLFDEISDPDEVAEGLDRWIQDEVKGVVKVRKLEDGLSFLALVHYFGRPIGSLTHSALGGKGFRAFLKKQAQKALGSAIPLSHLLDRPILGIASALDFSWGGLEAAELASLGPKLAEDAPDSPDEDHSAWMLDLWNALGSASDLGKDLVTVYT
jgi:hypothetical protein